MSITPYFTILDIKEDGTREVLSIVNHHMEGALLWQQELLALKERGVESIGLVVSDGLTGHRKCSAKSVSNGKPSAMCSPF
jgi:putative transposase